jgi:hypothetical protein
VRAATGKQAQWAPNQGQIGLPAVLDRADSSAQPHGNLEKHSKFNKLLMM